MTVLTSYSGVQPIADYSGATTAGAGIDILVALLPNVDATDNGDGAVAGGGFLDEATSAMIVQLRVELAALKAVVSAFN